MQSNNKVQMNFCYRDGGNWRKGGAIVFSNPDRLSVAKATKRLIAACEHPFADINQFVPERVGLDPLREGYDIDLDGPWHELESLEEVKDADRHPAATASDQRTLSQFVKAFEAAARQGWAEACDAVEAAHEFKPQDANLTVTVQNYAEAALVANGLVCRGIAFSFKAIDHQQCAFTIRHYARSLTQRLALSARVETIAALLSQYFPYQPERVYRQLVTACAGLTAGRITGLSHKSMAVRAWLKYLRGAGCTPAAEKRLQAAAAFWPVE